MRGTATEVLLRAELKNMGYKKLAKDIKRGGWTAATLLELRELVRRAQPEEK